MAVELRLLGSVARICSLLAVGSQFVVAGSWQLAVQGHLWMEEVTIMRARGSQ